MASLQFVLAAGLAMLMVVGLVQLVAYQYVRGAVVNVLERSVRAGSVAGAGVTECEAALFDSLSEALGGAVSSGLVAGCEESGGEIVARASGVVPAWLATGPELGFDVEASAQRELLP